MLSKSEKRVTFNFKDFVNIIIFHLKFSILFIKISRLYKSSGYMINLVKIFQNLKFYKTNFALFT